MSFDLMPYGERIAEFCAHRHIRTLSLFGSATGTAFGESSDIDILVEFEPEHIPGLIAFSEMEADLSDILGRKVDLRTAEDLSPYFRSEVQRSARPFYASKR